jgi:subtilisin-like proprotein convertase family protein
MRPFFVFYLILANSSLFYYTNVMSVTKTVNIPASRRLTIDVPLEVPEGQVILTFTPKAAQWEQKKERKFGCAKGQFRMAEDFDEPLEDFKDYM